MDYVMVTPMTRGQITLPKKYRDKYGIKPGQPIKVIDDLNVGIRIEPIRDGNIIKPKYSRQEYAKILDEISDYIKKHGPLWTKEDDRARERSLRAERVRWKKLNW